MNQKRKEEIYKLSGMLIPIGISFLMIAVQWGAITTKLNVFEDQIKMLIKANEKSDDTLIQVQKDVAFIKGKMPGE